jgi:tetratricopeptide (TPR) repeat protein
MAEHLVSTKEAENNLFACAAFLAENIQSGDGYGEAMKEIVPRYLEKGEVDLAAQFADAVADPFVRDRLLMLTAEKCAATGDDEYAFQLVESIEDFGLQGAARAGIAVQKSLKGEFEKALQVAETLDHADDAFADIAVQQAAVGEETNAFETIEKIDFANAKVNAWQNVALANLQKGETAKAVEYLDKALAAAGEIEFAEEKIRAFANIGNLFIETDRRDKSIETYDRAKNLAEKLDNVRRDYYLAAVALGFLRAGSLDLADRTLDLAADKTQIASCLNGFAQIFWANGERDEALETLEEAYAILKSQRDAETRDSRARFGVFGAIAVQFASFEKAERAIEIAQENIDETEKTTALASIAQVCALQGKDELARQSVNAIRDDAQRMLALIGASDAKNKLNEKEKAMELLNEAAALGETVPQFASRSSAYNELAARFQRYGESGKAREISLENLKIISQIRNESSRAVALAQLANVYEEAEFDLNDAEKSVLRPMIQEAGM